LKSGGNTLSGKTIQLAVAVLDRAIDVEKILREILYPSMTA
jgi:hypothetical protein